MSYINSRHLHKGVWLQAVWLDETQRELNETQEVSCSSSLKEKTF